MSNLNFRQPRSKHLLFNIRTKKLDNLKQVESNHFEDKEAEELDKPYFEMPSNWDEFFAECGIATKRETKLQKTLKKSKPLTLQRYSQQVTILSPSLHRKYKWAEKLYVPYAKLLKSQPFPIQSSTISSFIQFLCIECLYSIKSVENVVIPSLKSQHLQQTKEFDFSSELKLTIRSAFSSVRKSGCYKREGEGKEAALLDDVALIIERSNSGNMFFDFDCSLFLFAVHCGARSITCANVFLEDVKNVTISDLHAECILVEIRLRRLKGHPNSNHSVTIEGRFAHTSLHEQVRDPVYWLERHLQVNHHLSLKTRQKWPKNVLSKKLWDMSPAAMSLRFRKRSEQAGYPCKLFSFHSLRAGFICTAIMVAGTDEEKLRGILEHTAYVADWVPFGRAQLTYVRNTSKKITVCSRLVNPKPGDTVIDLALTSIAAYHSIKLSDPKRTIKEQFQTFRNAVNDHFNDAMKHLEDGEREIRNQWKKCAKAYIDKNENLSLRAKRAFTKKKSLLFRALKENDFHTIRMKIIRQDVVCKLSKSLANLDNLVDDFVNLSDYPVRRSLDLKGSFPQEASSNCTSSSNENDLSIQQSDEESQGQSENTEGSESTNTNSDGEGKQSNQECTSSSSTQSSSSATSSSSSSPSSVEVISDNPYQLPNRLLMNNKNSTSSNAIKVKKKQKKRRFFTKEEDELLRRCKQQKMRWCDMSLQFDGRSGQDLKDRWRNLQKKQWRRHPEYSRDEVLHCLKIIHDDEDENDAKENNTHAIKVIKDDANDCSLQRNESSESEDVDDSESCSDSSEWKEIKCEDSREDDEDDRNEEEVCCDNEQMNNDLTISIVDDEDEDLNAADELIRASYRNKSDSFTKKKKSLEELSKKTSSSSVVNCKEKKLKRRSGN